MSYQNKNKFDLNFEEPIPGLIDVEPVESRDAMNLVELPFATVQHQKYDPREVIKKTWTEQGKEWWIKLKPSIEYGAPSAFADDLLVAAQELTFLDGFKNQRIYCTKKDIMRSARWADNGLHSRRVETCFGQWSELTFQTNALWNEEKEQYERGTRWFRIFSDVSFPEKETRRKVLNGKLSTPAGYFEWAPFMWEDTFQAGCVKPLDTGTYFSFDTPIQRRGFRIIDKKTYHDTWVIDLVLFAFQKIGMRGKYQSVGHVKNKLQPHLKEINLRGLTYSQIVKSKEAESGYFIVSKRTTRRRAFPPRPAGASGPESKKAAEAAETTLKGMSETDSTRIRMLLSRGVKPTSTATKLVQQHPDCIETQVDIFDWQMETDRQAIKNPGAYLAQRIRENYEAPKGYVSKEEREKEKQLTLQLHAEYHQEAAKIDDRVKSLLQRTDEEWIREILESHKRAFINYHDKSPNEEGLDRLRSRAEQQFKKFPPTAETEREQLLQGLRDRLEKKAEELQVPLDLPYRKGRGFKV